MDTRNINTRTMTEGDLKAMLRQQAREEKIDLTNLQNRFTIWSENGNHFSYESNAADVFEKNRKISACIEKNGSRTAILDGFEDRLELVPSPGQFSSFRTA
ncbi:MAG: hypothetical protein WBQ10_11830 [Terriglobales bacterium]